MEKKKKWKKVLIIVPSVILALILIMPIIQVIGLLVPPMQPISYEPTKPDYWPTKDWLSSTPEEQGMDSSKLLEMVDYYNETHLEKESVLIDSITIVRNGYVVSEMYFNPLFPNETKHITHSVTKSVMSALIGIAIDDGYLESVDVKVIDIFDDIAVENRDRRWEDLTVKHVLTMQTGLNSRDSYLYGYEGLNEMQKTDNWTEHILMTSFEEDPGSRYEYSNYASFLLSAIIQKSTGQDTLEFAKENLFSPLGIDDVTWENSPEGVGIGWARMWLKPKDMAKIGQLYLQKGNWDGQQVISSQWIDDTLTAHSQPKKYRKVYNEQGKWDFMMSSGDWVGTNLNRPFADGYGYQFWLDKSGAYSAVGTGGQYIIVTPKENLVVVFTSKLSGDDAFYPKKLFDMILESIVSDGAISADQEAQSKLSLLSQPPKVLQEAEPMPDLPSTAAKISGETYELGENYWEYDNLKLVFEKGCDYAEIEYDARGSDKVRYQIGLDGTYKLSKCNDRTYAATGKWETADTFVFSLEVVGYSTKDEWRLTFANDIVQVEEIGVTGTQSYIGTQSE